MHFGICRSLLSSPVKLSSGGFKGGPGGHGARPRAYGSQKKINISKNKGPADVFGPGPRSP